MWCTCSDSGESLLKKKLRGTAENAGDEAGAKRESLIPIQSRPADAMSELASSAEPLLPPLALAAYIACVAGAAALANCSVLAALFKTSRSGLLTILVIQLAIADVLLGASIGPELWSYNTRSWQFGDRGCVAYRGLNVFASTASSYLVATVALHSLATINIEEKAIAKRFKRNDQDEDEEIRSSRHSLVTSSNSSTPPRTMNVDYRLTDRRISVTQPSVFVWVLAISLSVPEFVLATTVHRDQDVLCTIVDTSQRLHMYSILAVFNLFLPLIIMSIAGVLVIIKLKIKKILSQIECFESIAALKLSLWLIIVYIVMCTPRSFLTAYSIYSKSMQGNVTSLAQHDDMTTVNVATSSSYIFSTLVRPLLSISLLPHVRKSFSFAPYTNTDNV